METTSPRYRRDNDSTRKRSRSPHDKYHDEDAKRRRSRSPHRKHHHHRHRETQPAVRLPFRREPLRKGDLSEYEGLFAEYLDVQKQIDIDDLTEDEVKGRWKSFLGKWNRKELSEGWYDPDMKTRADERYKSRPKNDERKLPVRDGLRTAAKSPGPAGEDDEDDEDGYGPSLPDRGQLRLGPSMPKIQDLQHRQELANEERSARTADLRFERKLDRNTQKERLEELAPRADPGSRERQLEKKRETTAANRAFGNAKEAGTVEIGDGELMGGDDGIKAKIKANEKVKNERELRKEETLRARAAEREERMAAHRMKEDKTMEMLRSLAKERFG